MDSFLKEQHAHISFYFTIMSVITFLFLFLLLLSVSLNRLGSVLILLWIFIGVYGLMHFKVFEQEVRHLAQHPEQFQQIFTNVTMIKDFLSVFVNKVV